MLETLWFVLLAGMLATYVVLDGLDLGAGILHLFVARSDAEREQVIRSIGPVWDGNEVWLLAAGGTMFFAFPTLLATAFSGFYLPLMIVLWLLVFRALAIELRHQVADPIWTQFWDVALGAASILLAVFFGAALGNVIRGVPLDADGVFFEPLWTDFRVGEATGILDWYTILIGVLALVALAHHGALWLFDRTDAAVQERADRVAGFMWMAVVVLTVLGTIATFYVQANVGRSLAARPSGLIFPLFAGAGLVASSVFRRRGAGRRAFHASAVFLCGMLGSAAIGLYPYVLPARNEAHGLTAADAASAPYGLGVALAWWIPGIVIACGYFTFLYRTLPATFSVADTAEH
ncbi:MAG: cytochrome d ubiquinol oxidase subunit II [Candidatus Palauibacterales bacterium]|nr:cytochrome d ubiquinol oxidase subunit II [Candidatus Palauibacterales bacterium]MDP2483047.1 cytochrome d ubiquinol oxidase subunit II [Candidatus Palauibacterales bacterium]